MANNVDDVKAALSATKDEHYAAVNEIKEAIEAERSLWKEREDLNKRLKDIGEEIDAARNKHREAARKAVLTRSEIRKQSKQLFAISNKRVRSDSDPDDRIDYMDWSTGRSSLETGYPGVKFDGRPTFETVYSILHARSYHLV